MKRKHLDYWIALLLTLAGAYSTQTVAQPIDVRIDRDPAVEDYDFSWVYWFETHGQRYLREAVAEKALPWDTPASRRWRGQVIEALLPMLQDDDAGVRAAAVLALAKIGHEGLLEEVLPGGGGKLNLLLDESGDVRLSAWVSLGLLQTDAARAALGVEPLEGLEEIDRVGQAVAIGLMTKLDRVHAKWLLGRLEDAGESLEVKRWCVWAMTRHDDASVDEAFDTVLVRLPSTFMINEVLANRAYVERRGGSRWLGDVLRYHPDMRGWQGYRSLSAMPAAGLNGSTPRRLAVETRVGAALAIGEQPVLSDEEDRVSLLRQLHRRMVPGNSAQVMDFNRGFDTLAYFMHCKGTQDDRDLLYNQLRGFASLRKDDPGVLEKLEEGEEPSEKDLFVRQSDNELRGYAAIAVGLLIRRATEGTVLHEQRPVIVSRAIEIERLKRRFGRRLMRAVADDSEPVSYRAACALALGLSGDERYREELAIELGQLRTGDEAVLGYGLLALSMLGEDRVSGPALRYLTRPGRVLGVGDQLGRRAVLRALAVLDQAGGPAFADIWGRDPWVSLHAAEAAAWSGQYDAVPAMINALQSESVAWRRTAAISLGRVFEASWPSRLSGLTDGSNPTLSLRPAVELQPDRIVIKDTNSPTRPGAWWPMGRVYALDNPFFIVMKRGEFEQPAGE
ncbi:MAG: HEAT repeat domain-containing protein [Planctomycetota bacterium]